jgi:hypothetical protein
MPEHQHDNNTDTASVFQPRPIGPLTLDQQVTASADALAEVDRGHYQAVTAAVETLHRQLAAGVDPRVAYQNAVEAAGEFVTAARPGSAVTALDIAMADPDDHWRLHEVAAAERAAAQLAGTELDSAKDALGDHRVRGAADAPEAVDWALNQVEPRLWAGLDQARAWYGHQISSILEAYPSAGPVRGALVALGYHEGDRGRTLREGEVARQARDVEAEMVWRYFQHEVTATAAIRAFHEHLTAGTPAGEAKDQALAEAAEFIAQANQQPPQNTTTADATAADADASMATGEDAAAMQVLQAGQTTTAWLAGGELETASDAVDHFHARQVAAAQLDPAQAPAYVDLVGAARRQAMSRLTGWYREAATLHTAQTRAGDTAAPPETPDPAGADAGDRRAQPARTTGRSPVTADVEHDARSEDVYGEYRYWPYELGLVDEVPEDDPTTQAMPATDDERSPNAAPTRGDPAPAGEPAIAEQVRECGAAVDHARDVVEIAERAHHADQTSRQHADQAARDADQTRDPDAGRDPGLDSGLGRP